MMRVPLLRRRIDAGRVVAARVQHDDGARGNALERARSCRRNRGRASRRRSTAYVLTVKPAPSNSARWFSQLGSLIHTCAPGAKLAQEIGADLESAGAAERLHGHRAARGDDFAVRAEQQRLHRAVVGGDAVDRQVAARRRLVGRARARRA